MPWILDLKRTLILQEKNTPRGHWFKNNLKLVLDSTTHRFLTMCKLFTIRKEKNKNLSYTHHSKNPAFYLLHISLKGHF